MADAQSNIKVSIDTTEALASIKNLQRQISAFHTSMAKSGAAANAVTAQMQQNLINSVNATGKFSAQMKTIKTTTESFTDSLQKNKFSMGEYFRYAGGASKTFGRLFKTEFDTINKVARENVKDLQTQYIKMGRDASGSMKAIAVRPLSLDMNDLATKTMIASERQALLNQLLKQGSTNLLNFGKNTQWAGRQLMVGFTIPLMAVGAAASKTFMEMESQAIRFKKVYGDLFTPASETQAALEEITELGKQFTKYGIAVSTTVGLAAEAAAAGFQGLDLQRQTTAATKLSILGQVDSQKALETTIALQNAFSMSSENLAESIDFLNAVENQTVLSLDDVSTAIPKAAPIIQQLGGDVKDLAFFMTAMKEGGINASEGANAIKSGLASLINPTGKANEMLLSFGINARKIVEDNKGDLKKTVVEFATALNQLDPLNRAQAIEQMFGKFQFSRLSTLFANVTKEGTQAARVLDLAGSSIQELAALSEKELGMTSESAMNKFKGAVEDLKLSLVPVGEEFLKAVTPIAEFVSKILDRFNNLGEGTKKVIVTMTAIVAGLGPVLLMTFGLLANGLANIIKGFTAVKTLFNKTGQSSATLGTEVKYMTLEQRNAAAVASSLDQVHKTLAQTFTSEAAAVNALTAAYQRSIAAQAQFMPVAKPMGRGPIKKFAKGRPSVIGGTGNKDSELALLQPGETVIPTKMSKKYAALINGMIANNIPGYKRGRGISFGGKTYDIPVSSNEKAIFEAIGRFSKDITGVTSALEILEQQAQQAGASFEALNSDNLKSALEQEGATRNNPKGSSATLFDNEKYVFAHAKPQNAEITDPSQIRAMAQSTSSKSLSRDLLAAADSGGKVQQLSSFGFMMPESANKRTSGGQFEMGRDEMASLFTGPKAERTLSPIYQSWAESNGLALKDVLADPKLTKEMHSSVGKFGGLVGDEIKKLPKNFGEKEFYAAVDSAVKRIDVADTKLTRAVSDMQQTSMLAVDNSKSGKVLERRTVGKKDSRLRKLLGTPKRFTNYKDIGNRNMLVMGDKVAQASGAKDAAAYNRGAASASTPKNDKYMTNRSKQRSAHHLAPKDGTDDGKAYSTAVQKSIDRQNRKLAKQGKPPVGQSVVAAAPTRRGRLMAGAKRLPGRMNSMGGGMGLLGANMGLSMMPDFAGKGVAQGALTGANLGMMFGRYGMVAGAAIGLVATAIGGLIEKQRELKKVTEATFKGSAEVATFFGNTAAASLTPISNFSREMVALSKNAKDSQAAIGLTAEEISGFNQMVQGLPEDNALATIVRGISKESNPDKIKETSQAFVQMQVALGQIKPEDGQKLLNLILTASGKSNMIGTISGDITTQAEAIKKSIDGSAASFNTLKLTIGQVVAAAANTTSLEQLQVYLDGISASGYNGAAGINALRQSFLDLGNVGAAQVVGGLARKGLNMSQIATIIKAQNKGMDLDGKKTGKDLLKEAIDFNKKISEISKTGSPTTNPYQSQNDSLSGQNSLLDAQIKALEKKKKLVDEEIDAQKKITSELKRQNDFQSSQRDLESQIINAKLRGNFIEAASLQQEKANKAIEYKQEGALTPLEDKSADIQKQIDALKEKKDANSQVINSNNTNSNNNTTNNTTNNYSSKPGKSDNFDEGSFKKPIPTKSLKEAYENAPQLKPKIGGALNAGIDPSRWNQPGLGFLLGAGSVRSQIKKYAEDQQYLPGEFFTLDHNNLRYKFKVDNKKGNEGNIVMVGKPVAIKKEVKKANGGLIRGPGTGRSDSIRATLGYAGGGSLRVSNGEFVVKASSVKDYGISKMNAINNGTANVNTNSGSTVYNINMPITSNNANPEGVANEVMRRLKVELNKNNKSNAVRV